MTKKELKKMIAELEEKFRSERIELILKQGKWIRDVSEAMETANESAKLAAKNKKEADEWKAKYLAVLMQNIELAEMIKGASNEQREAD